MPSLHLTLQADLGELATADQPIETFFAELSPATFDEFEVYNVRLAIQELCTNIVRHAYAGRPGTISLSLSVTEEGDWVEVNTLDHGPHHFDHADWQAPQLDAPQEHGLGIWLMQRLMGEVQYQRVDGTNRWRLRKNMADLTAITSAPDPTKIIVAD